MGIGAGKNEVWAVALRNGVAPWVAAHPTSINVAGRASVCRAITAWLERLAFHVTCLGPEPGIIIATRAGVGPLRIGMTGHYDVETIGLGWTHPPLEVTRSHDRVFGRGMADNLGPLWLRLATLEAHVGPAPTLLFVLQGEEEIGSPAAHSAFPALELPHVDLWLEETGYFEARWLATVARLQSRRDDRAARCDCRAGRHGASTHHAPSRSLLEQGVRR